MERIATIGCSDCGGAAEFGDIVDVAMSASGAVWIADRDEPRIRGFTLSGRPLPSFGRSGRGPGEFASIQRLLMATDGSMHVVDMVAHRVTRVDSLGKHLASTPDRRVSD